VWIGGLIKADVKLDQTGPLRFAFVVLGLLVFLAVYLLTRRNSVWDVGGRQVAIMGIGAVLYAIFSYLFNGALFAVPSLDQISLRPAIAIPMFLGYLFGPAVGFVTGAVGNMLGDALTGFGFSPQWSIANGLIGLIAGMWVLFSDREKSLSIALDVSVALALIATAIYALNPHLTNLTFYDPGANVFGDQEISLFAGLSAVIGLVLAVVIRFVFNKQAAIAAAVTWSMLGNFVGIGFAALSDIWINRYPPAVAVVGEFLPAAGANLIFAVILVPLFVVAYTAIRQRRDPKGL
jgi:uncharacterized membrane protein